MSTTKTSTLAVTGPAWCTSMTFPEFRGDTLVIDRKGVEVPAKAVATLIDTAAKNGVTITEVSN